MQIMYLLLTVIHCYCFGVLSFCGVVQGH